MLFSFEATKLIKARESVWGPRYDMLDGWRGIAALAVVVQHVYKLRVGHAAVMLFFVISGYCITASATSCLKRGYGFRQFMWRRIRRIYPPYLFAVAYFVITRFVKLVLTGSNTPNYPTEMWLQNVSLTQWFTLLHTQYAFAADNPANFVTAFWSLQYEEQFYLLVALMMLVGVFFKTSLVRVALPLIAASILWNILFPTYSHGIFLEYWLHFGIGLLIFYRLCRIRSVITQRTLDLVLVAVAVCSAWYAWFVEVDWFTKRPLGMELFVVAVFGLVIILLRPFNDLFSASLVGRALMKLGAISYSLYLIHQCNLRLVSEITSRLLPTTWESSSMVLQLALHVVLAIPFYLLFERPFLNKSLVPSARATSPEEVPVGFPEAVSVSN